MDQESPTADFGAEGGGALDHVFQHPCTQTTPFVLDTDAKSRQQSGMYGQCTSYGDEWQPRLAHIRSQHDCSHRPLSAPPGDPLVEGAFAPTLNRPMDGFGAWRESPLTDGGEDRTRQWAHEAGWTGSLIGVLLAIRGRSSTGGRRFACITASTRV